MRALGMNVMSVTRPNRVGLIDDVAVMMVVSFVPVMASEGTLTVTVTSKVWSVSKVAVPGNTTVPPFNVAETCDQPCELLHVSV